MKENEIRNLVGREFQKLRFTTKGPYEPVTVEEANILMHDLEVALTRILIEYDRERRG